MLADRAKQLEEERKIAFAEAAAAALVSVELLLSEIWRLPFVLVGIQLICGDLLTKGPSQRRRETSKVGRASGTGSTPQKDGAQGMELFAPAPGNQCRYVQALQTTFHKNKFVP